MILEIQKVKKKNSKNTPQNNKNLNGGLFEQNEENRLYITF